MISFQLFLMQLFLLLPFYQRPVSGQENNLDQTLRANNYTCFADFLQRHPDFTYLLVPGVICYAPTNAACEEFLAGNPEIPVSNNSSRLVKRRATSSNSKASFQRRPSSAKLRKRALEIPQQGLVVETGDGGIESTVVQKPPSVEGQEGRLFTGDGLLVNVAEEIGLFDVPGGQGEIYSVDSFLQISDEPSEFILNPANNLTYLREISSRLPQLLSQLSNARSLTFIAPTQEAFDESGLDVANSSLEDLQAFLDYHTIIDSHVLYTPSIQNASSYTTQGGKKLVATWDGVETFYINDARVVGSDRITSNGVIQVINKVLTPPSDNATTVPGPNGPLALGEDPSVDTPTTPTEPPPQATNAASIATSDRLLSGLGFILALMAGVNMF